MVIMSIFKGDRSECRILLGGRKKRRAADRQPVSVGSRRLCRLIKAAVPEAGEMSPDNKTV